MHYELSRRDRLYLVVRHLHQCGYGSQAAGDDPDGRLLLHVEVEGRDQQERVARIVHGCDPEARRLG